MKRLSATILSLLLILGTAFGLFSCGNKLPTTVFEKVQFALNGVEKSLKSSKSSKLSHTSDIGTEAAVLAYDAPIVKLMVQGVADDSLFTIYNALAVEEKTSNPEFEYDEPPMIQFQYLKAVFEATGEDFVFGTKYSNTSTGTIYYDFETRTATVDERFLNAYSLTCSMVLNIDSNDLITAQVGFDLTFTNNGVSRHEKMYVEMILDYDMNETSPTYELSMNAITDLLDYEAEDEKYFDDEYDYVKVEKNSITEWRKFGICSPVSLTGYQNDDFTYKYSVLRAFKDSKKYRLENEFNKDQSLKEAVVDCLDLTNLLSAYNTFFTSNGVENDKLKTAIDRFGNIYGKDIVNSLVYTGATEKWVDDREQEQGNLFLREESTGGYQIGQDAKLIDLFNPNVGWSEKGVKQYLTIYYKSGEENTLATYNDFSELNVKVRSTSYGKAKWIDTAGKEDWLLTDYIKASGFAGYYDESNLDYSFMSLEFDISLKTNPEVKLQSNFTVDLMNGDCYRSLLNDWSLVVDYINSYAPLTDVIPAFPGTDTTCYSPSISDDGTSGMIKLNDSNGLSSQITEYENTLVSGLNFVKNTYGNEFTKRISDDYLLTLTVYSDEIRFEFKAQEEQKQSVTDVLKQLIDNNKIEIPEFSENCEYTVDGNVIRIQTNSDTLISEYVESLGSYGFTVYNEGGSEAAIQYVDGIFYRIRDLGKSFYLEKVQGSLTLVGDWNGWAASDAASDLKTLSVKNGWLYLSMETTLKANQAFKIVKNHSWEDGGYGFNLFAASESSVEYKENFECGESDNIVVKEGGTYTIGVRIELLTTSSVASENNIIPVMIEIGK